jgi:hypothetical protein
MAKNGIFETLKNRYKAHDPNHIGNIILRDLFNSAGANISNQAGTDYYPFSGGEWT